LLTEIDAAISELRDDGTLAQLSERAFGADLSSPPDTFTAVEPTPEVTTDG
jgi:hypothetical protein